MKSAPKYGEQNLELGVEEDLSRLKRAIIAIYGLEVGLKLWDNSKIEKLVKNSHRKYRET